MSEAIETEVPEAPAEKPPPTVIGVQGFDGLRKQGADTVDWSALVRLPTFQMFMEELEPNVMGIPSDRWALERAHAMCSALGDPGELFRKYEAWHAEKGYWPNETPYGEPK